LDALALARFTLDRAAQHRADPGLLPRLLADPATRVLLLSGTSPASAASPAAASPASVSPAAVSPASVSPAAVSPASEAAASVLPAAPVAFVAPVTGFGEGRPKLVVHSPTDLRADPPVEQAMGQPGGAGVTGHYLGEDADGRSYLGLDLGEAPRPALPAGASWHGLRELGALLDDTDAGLLTGFVALATWHRLHPRCARCGEPTAVVEAGWSRRCPKCRAQHFPRTDPAVIMSVVDPAGRILLGRQVTWPERAFSTLAGFVESGESLEAAVRREVREEAGIRVGDVRYLGSQPWPFPSSLMLGFTALALDTEIAVDRVELAEAHWWDPPSLAAAAAAGEVLLPGPVSIARRLIEHWYGGPLTSHDARR
jgi:NAD+ diphosphatase